MWGCTRFPECRWAENIDPEPAVDPTIDTAAPLRPGLPGSYAQARLERERERYRLKRRATLPLFVAFAVISMTVVFYSAQGLGTFVASIGAVVVGFGVLLVMLRLPFDSLVWAKGVEGERRTAAFLEPLLDAGFVVLNNRQIPGGRGDIDHLVIGPTGVFPIETKNWSGRVEVRNDRLIVGSRDRTWVVEQVYREALAVQLALGEELTSRRVTVTPVICAIGGVAWFDRIAAGVHVTSGRELAKLISDRPIVFDDEQVQQLARLADQRLRVHYAWKTEG